MSKMWPFTRSLEDALNNIKSVRIHGVKFSIRKLDPTAYLDGSKVMLQSYDVYKVDKNSEVISKNLDKIKDHYKDVFMASVVSPKLSRKPGENAIFVDHLFTEWDLANKLYVTIIEHTYGKKKLSQDSLSEVSLKS